MGSPGAGKQKRAYWSERAKDQGMILARMVGTTKKKRKNGGVGSWKEIRERERVGEKRESVVSELGKG